MNGTFRRRIRLGTIAAVVLVAAAIALARWRSPRPHYVTAAVSRGVIQKAVATTGALNPVTTVQVGSYVSGTIKKLSCDFNSEVTVGQPCALVDPVPFQLIVDQDRAELDTATAQLKKDQAALVYAKEAYERDAKLVAEGTVSQDTVDNEKSAFAQADAQIGLDRASIEQKQAALRGAQVNLDYTNIVSPVVGTVITRSIDVGQTVAASLQTPTLFIIGKDLTKMQVDTNVSEADVGGVRVGQTATFSVQAYPGRTFRGAVTQIRRGPITVQNVVTYDVVVAFDNPQRLLFPGMTADTHIITDERHDVLRVPLTAIRFTPHRPGESRTDGHGAASGMAPGSGVPPAEPGGGSSSALRETRPPASGEAAPSGPGEGPPSGGTGERPRGEHRGGWAGGRGPGGPREGHHRDRTAEHRGQVWVLADGKIHPVAVTTGLDDGTMIEVSGPGLTEGTVVVVNEIGPDDEKRPSASTPLNPAIRPGGPRF